MWRDGDAELAPLLSDRLRFGERVGIPNTAAHDLKLIPSGHYQQLTQEITEIKRVLTVLVQKLNADRWCAKRSLALLAG